MNLEYLQEPLEHSSPFDIADLYLQENPTYREAVEKGIISREDVALFWAFMKAEHECITAPVWPLNLKESEEAAYQWLAARTDSDIPDLKKRLKELDRKIDEYREQKYSTETSHVACEDFS